MRVLFEEAGFVVVSGHIDDLRRGALDLPNFVSQHDPRVIVYDVPPPYVAHWRFLEHIRQSPDMQQREFVVTCTNVRRLQEVVGITEQVHELVGRPDDLQRLKEAVIVASRTSTYSSTHADEELTPSSLAEA